jgi:biopolymer transport protein ExbB
VSGIWLSVQALLHGGLIGVLVKGGLVMIPLFVSSVLSLTVILERAVFWRRVRTQAIDTIILQCVAAGNLAHALQMAHASSHPVARVLYAGLAYHHRSPGTAMTAAAQTERQRVKAYVPVLDTIITLTPLLGLLGTITGMISAFGIVSEAGLGQPQAITGGVAEALIATATGLCIAIMTLIPYNYFRAAVEHLTERMEEQATRLELLLSPRGEDGTRSAS